MSEPNETKATKVRATLDNGVLTFPTTGNTLDITKLFPTYAEMNDGQKYAIEYGCRQFAQDVIASEPKEGTKAEAQAARITLVLAGNRPTKASSAASSIKLADIEKKAFDLACETGDVSLFAMLVSVGAMTEARKLALVEEVMKLRTE